jgi:hypothetical protein
MQVLALEVDMGLVALTWVWILAWILVGVAIGRSHRW